MLSVARGRYAARFAETPADLERAQALRQRCFRDGVGRDDDRFDPVCRHLLVESQPDGGLVCCYRLLALASGRDIGQCYSAQFYGLSALQGFAGPMLEMGRFCIDPTQRDPDILRIAWGALTRHVDQSGAGMLFGCSSFQGTDPSAYLDAFMLLKDRHLAPRHWSPRQTAPVVFDFAGDLAARVADPRRAVQTMPPLLRSYLAMGGWVSDHAVVDRDLGTLHVFTGLEIGAIPAGRARLLRGLAG